MTNNKLISFCIFTYNQQKYILEALNAAVKQTYDNLEIIISDDCSTDDTFKIVSEFAKSYNGPHKLIINRNEKNLRHREHFNKVIYNIAHGDIIAVSAGDDISLPTRIQQTADFFNMHPSVMSVHFLSEQVDNSLNKLSERYSISRGLYSVITLEDYVKDMKSRFWLYSGDSRAFRKEVIQFFPPLEISHNEDLPMFLRCLMLGPTALLREPLVLHRIHSGNESARYRFKQEGKDLFVQLEKDVEHAYIHSKVDDIAKIKLKLKIKKIHWGMMLSDLKRLLFIMQTTRFLKEKALRIMKGKK